MQSPLKRIYPHIRNGRYYNYAHETPTSFVLHTLRSYMRSMNAGKRYCPSKVQQWVEESRPHSATAAPAITWIGHSSFLITIDGISILTDPVFGPLSLFYKRFMPPGIHHQHLPAIDFVLISHNHRDHMDAPTLMRLKQANPEMTVLVPQGDRRWFIRRGFARVIEATWWQQLDFNHASAASGGIRITFLPAIHWSQRGLFDKNRSLWGSWMLECNGFKVYFAGDTAFGDHFAMIAHEFPGIDVALVPIGPCEPRMWLQSTHIGAEQAGHAFVALKAGHCIPMHWGTFGFGVDMFDAPIVRIQQWWHQHQHLIADKQLHCVKVGQQKLFSTMAESVQSPYKQPLV